MHAGGQRFESVILHLLEKYEVKSTKYEKEFFQTEDDDMAKGLKVHNLNISKRILDNPDLISGIRGSKFFDILESNCSRNKIQ